MIKFSTRLTEVLTKNTIDGFFLLSITRGSAPFDPILRVSTFYRDIIMGDGHTYVADMMIVSADPPRIESTVNNEFYTVKLADVDFWLAENVAAGMVGCKLEARLVFIDTDTGEPLTDMADTLIVYKGRVSGTSYTLKLDMIGESILEVTCSSPMYELDRKNALLLSRDSFRKLHPGDSSFDQVHQGSRALLMKWGK